MNPQYPVYIPTKGRWGTRFTSKAFDELGVEYMAVIEPQEVDKYVAAGLSRSRIIVLPHSDKGLVVTRNWIWDHAQASGTPYFWTFDDNITGFLRLNRNSKVQVGSGTIFRVAEEFVSRYQRDSASAGRRVAPARPGCAV